MAAKITIVDNTRAVIEAITTKIPEKLKLSAIVVMRLARQKCVRGKSGDLARSIDYILRAKSVDIGPTLPYGLFIEYGVKPHDIYPKAKRALYWEDLDHPISHALHPGFVERPFLRPALVESISELQRIWNS